MPTMKNRGTESKNFPVISLAQAMGRGNHKYDHGRNPHDYLFNNIKNNNGAKGKGRAGKKADPLHSTAGYDVATTVTWTAKGGRGKKK